MLNNKPLFRFNSRVAESDTTGYYVTHWDSAMHVSVIAHERDESIKKVKAMMGTPRDFMDWAVRIDSAEEIENDNH